MVLQMTGATGVAGMRIFFSLWKEEVVKSKIARVEAAADKFRQMEKQQKEWAKKALIGFAAKDANSLCHVILEKWHKIMEKAKLQHQQQAVTAMEASQ